MSKLILFSGGVESTALLSQLDPVNDYALVVDQVWENNPEANSTEIKGFDEHDIEQICEHYKFYNVIWLKQQLTYFPIMRDGANQRWMIYPAILNLLGRMPHITEVSSGFNKSEPITGHSGAYGKFKKMVGELFPNVTLTEPLAHLTKREQLAMIDEAIRHHVVSCHAIKSDPSHNPSTCGKCKEVAEHMEL